MTQQTTTSIGLDDLRALRFQCKECAAILVLPFAADIGKTVTKCPKCRKGWTTVENVDFSMQITQFVHSIEGLLPHLNSMGFDFSLETELDGGRQTGLV